MAQFNTHVVSVPGAFMVLRIIQLVLAFIIMGLLAYLTRFYHAHVHHAKANVVIGGFDLGLYTTLLTFVLISYYSISSVVTTSIYNRWIVLVLESLTTLFWLITFALIAAGRVLLSHSSSGFAPSVVMGKDYFDCVDDNGVSQSDCSSLGWSPAKRSESTNNFGDVSNAALAFSIIMWLLFDATLVIYVMSFVKYRKANVATSGTYQPTAQQPPSFETSEASQMNHDSGMAQPSWPYPVYQKMHEAPSVGQFSYSVHVQER